MSIFVKDVVQMAEAQLQRCGVSDAKVDAELIFRYLLNVDKMGFFKLWGTSLDDATSDRYLDLIAVRSQGMPLQYITGEQEFMGFRFSVNPDVLIPRQDTEVLVEEIVQTIQARKKRNCAVFDLGCGSGAIGISIAKLCEDAKVTASDISKGAIETAKRNAKALGVEKRMSFSEGNLFEPFQGRFRSEKFDIIVSNPPYIKSHVIPTLQVEVKDHEPLLALDGGEDGLDYYRQIMAKVHIHLKKGGILALEIGHDQARAVVEIAADYENFNDLKLIKDLAGNDRGLIFYP
ncbi:MAG: peptide chain release factor N(5)-glutamine methyltransferase [Clostridiales bacterium]|nr:peptide chain release factor N(5)-glutamine methyltransferase [Clostridiales bacterium]